MTTGYALACEGCGRWVWGGGMYHSAVREPDVHATEALDLRSVHVIETVVAQHHGASPRRQAVAARGSPRPGSQEYSNHNSALIRPLEEVLH